jgi:AraC-like DNA-binding protein
MKHETLGHIGDARPNPAPRGMPAQPPAGLPGIGVTGRVVQGISQEFRRLSAAMPSLIAVRCGQKTVRSVDVDLRAEPGDLVIYPAHLAADVGNVVALPLPFAFPQEVGAGERPVYIADFIAFDPDFLLAHAAPDPAPSDRVARDRDERERAPQPLRQPLRIDRAPQGFLDAFDAARNALAAPGSVPAEIAAHRVAELLLWIRSLTGAVLVAPQNTTAARVRALLSADPAHPWTAAEVAGRIGASEATFRRKLAAETTSFAQILNDVRMSTALTLIQTSTLPILEVAAAVGYDSPSRFAVRFRQRFGMAPTAIRGHQRD